MKKNYQIKNITEKQLLVLKDALEMYTRLGLLQFDKLIDHMFNFRSNTNINKSYLKNRDMIDYHINEIKKLLVEKDPELSKYSQSYGWSLGIGSPNTDIVNKISYEMQNDINIFIKKMDGIKANPKLKFSDENDLIVENQNNRKEKLIKLLSEKIKENNISK